VRVERVGIPMLTAIPLLTLPQFIMLQYVNGKAENWHTLSGMTNSTPGVGAGFSPVVFTGAGGADVAGRGAVQMADAPPAAAPTFGDTVT
jgi:glucan biosynthesis protein C